jgi:hypothetical protein
MVKGKIKMIWKTKENTKTKEQKKGLKNYGWKSKLTNWKKKVDSKN